MVCEKAFYDEIIKDSALAGDAKVYLAEEVPAHSGESSQVEDEEWDSDLTLDSPVFYFHTSGSTSGIPKVVPYSYRWLQSAIDKSKEIMEPVATGEGHQDVTTWMGSVCHVGQTFMLLGALQHGSCTIQPTTIAFSMTEVDDMVKRCGLNRANQFAAFLSGRIKQCKDKQVLGGKAASILAGLGEVLVCGALPKEDEDWALANGVKLRVSSIKSFVFLDIDPLSRDYLVVPNVEQLSSPSEAVNQISSRLWAGPITPSFLYKMNHHPLCHLYPLLLLNPKAFSNQLLGSSSSWYCLRPQIARIQS